MSKHTPLQDGRFLLLEALGRGGMGAVYRAFDRAEQRLVALKVLCARERPGPSHPLSTEFDIWNRLRHPNVVRAHELRLAEHGPIDEGSPYLVLEHIDGGPLHERLCPGEAGAGELGRLAQQILSALVHVHALGYIHRDLKPANVLVRRGGKPTFKLTDFGLAARRGAVSRVGSISGSVPYIAPETLLGLPLDGRADLYGLGILLYYLATGRMPMPGVRPSQILRWHLTGRAPDPQQLRPELSPRLCRLVVALTHKDRAARPASAEEALALFGVHRIAGSAPGAGVSGEPSRNRLRLALDTVRLGARRAVRLPGCRVAASALAREVSIWSQIRGVPFYSLTRDASRLVLRLVVERGPDGIELMHRSGLRNSMPLKLLGGALLLAPRRMPREALAVQAAGRDMCRFLLGCAATRPMVLWVEPGALQQPLVRETTRQLLESVTQEGRTIPCRGGLLLMTVEERRARTMASGGSTEALG